MNPLKKLYLEYCEETIDNHLLNIALKKLLDIKELDSITNDLIEGMSNEKEETFYAGFNTAVQLFIGGVLNE